MLARILIAFLLMTGMAFAQKDGLTKSNHYYIAAYSQLGFDTSGPSFLSQDIMNEFVFRAVDQMPNWVYGREIVDTFKIDSGRQEFFLDSLVSRVVSVWKIDHDSIKIIRQRPFSRWNQDHPDGVKASAGSQADPEYFSLFSDTLYLYPMPKKTTQDTLRIFYYQQPTFDGDSLGANITMPRVFQLGVVYYAVYLAEVRLQRGKWKAAWERYTMWVQATQAAVVRKPVDLFKGESLGSQ